VLLASLIPVANNLSDPRTRLNNLFPALERAASIVAPAAQTQADLFVNLDTTFSALADVARPFIQDTISNGPPALSTAIRVLPFQRTFLANTTELVRDLRPGVRALSTAAPAISEAFTVGTPALLRSVALNRRLETTFNTLNEFSNDPRVPLGLGDLTSTVQLLNPTLASLAPTQLTCNYITLFFRNISSLLSEGDSNGNLAAVHHHHHAAGAEQRGRSRLRASRRARMRTTTSTRTRTRTSAPRARTTSARRPTRSTSRARR
jgi:hypothetical protein